MRCLDAIPLALALGAAALTAQEPTRTNGIGMEFVLIRPGSMVVGRFQPACPEQAAGEPQRDAMDPRTRWTAADFRRCEEMVQRDAMPGFTVHITRPYYIGKYEVTQAEWRKVMGTNPSVFQGKQVAGDASRHPVDNVTWADAQAFVRRLNAMDTTAHYRLPTEFEWEYAARAGAERDLTWAQIREQAQLMLVDKGTTQPVGGKTPNAWGLYDTLGNVWEWVQDYYNEKLFADPTPPQAGTEHVLRGGSFLSDVKNTTYFARGAGPGSGFDVGFRIVRDVR
jgi:formylglycine-generating enzyme required for sulfatase activity